MIRVLTDVVDHSVSLAKAIFKQISTNSYDYFYWTNKFDYWESYLKLIRCLILRSFFDPDYNIDIEAI